MRWIVIGLLILSSHLQSQSVSPSIEQQLADLELEIDSIALFSFLDSVLLLPSPTSELSLRVGYMSSRLTAGRDFNLEQKGYTTGMAYYHKSGFYTDLSTFFDANYRPAAYQTILHAGYFWMPTLKWTINPYAERSFFHNSFSSDLSNSLGMSISLNTKAVDLGIDYAYLWGNDIGHRLIPSLSKRIRIKGIPLVKSISLYPSLSLIAGTSSIFKYQYSTKEIDAYLLQVQQLTDDEIRFLVVSGRITTAQAIQLRITRRLLNEGSEADIATLKELLNTLEESDTFALLNITLSLPLTFSINKTNFLISYSYAFPQQLPGEDLGVNPSGFFNISISQRFNWNKK
jgi:hypothetical protein